MGVIHVAYSTRKSDLRDLDESATQTQAWGRRLRTLGFVGLYLSLTAAVIFFIIGLADANGSDSTINAEGLIYIAVAIFLAIAGSTQAAWAIGMGSYLEMSGRQTMVQTSDSELQRASVTNDKGTIEEEAELDIRSRFSTLTGNLLTESAQSTRSETASSIAAGFYPDPEDSAMMRYWDGTTWTSQKRPK